MSSAFQTFNYSLLDPFPGSTLQYCICLLPYNYDSIFQQFRALCQDVFDICAHISGFASLWLNWCSRVGWLITSVFGILFWQRSLIIIPVMSVYGIALLEQCLSAIALEQLANPLSTLVMPLLVEALFPHFQLRSYPGTIISFNWSTIQ